MKNIVDIISVAIIVVLLFFILFGFSNPSEQPSVESILVENARLKDTLYAIHSIASDESAWNDILCTLDTISRMAAEAVRTD